MLKKIRKIRRGKKGAPRQMYFTADTQKSIEKILVESDIDKKKQIYQKEVQPAFEKLAENLILVYGFSSPYESFNELQNDCISFMFETIHKWDPSRGTKAFSYFNVVAKNWLIVRCRKHKKLQTRNISISEPSDLTLRQKDILESHSTVRPPDEIMISAMQREEIMKALDEISNYTTSETEKLCLHAIRTVFENIDELDFLNKRAILVYIREISGLPPKRLSVAMSSIRRYYRKIVGPDKKINLF